jgi:hypothetical protein
MLYYFNCMTQPLKRVPNSQFYIYNRVSFCIRLATHIITD